MGSSSESVCDQLDGGVDDEADEHARSEDFGIRTLLLVQVPCATHSEEFARVSCAVQNDHHNVDDLFGKGVNRVLL